MHKPLCNSTYDCSLWLYLFHLPCWNSCVLSALMCSSCVLPCALSMHAVARPFSICHPAVALGVYSCWVAQLLLCLFLHITLCFVCAAVTVSYTVRMLTLKPNS
jgi:hypothetical protein